MIRQCAWCKKMMGEVVPIADKSVTHTTCEDCFAKIIKEKHIHKGNPCSCLKVRHKRGRR